MSRKRKNHTPGEKVAIFRCHLLSRVQVAQIPKYPVSCLGDLLDYEGGMQRPFVSAGPTSLPGSLPEIRFTG